MSELATYRIFVDAAGNPVAETSPEAASLAVPIGHPIPKDLAAKLKKATPAKKSAKKPTPAAD